MLSPNATVDLEDGVVAVLSRAHRNASCTQSHPGRATDMRTTTAAEHGNSVPGCASRPVRLRRSHRLAGIAAGAVTLAAMGAYTVHANVAGDAVVPGSSPAFSGHQSAPSAFTGYQIVTKDDRVNAGGFVRDTAICPVGKKVFGGGASVIGEGTADFKTVIRESTPGTIGGNAQSLWLVALANGDSRPHTIRISAICGTVS
jgi:hypothetical protein